jgi:hypothetical protein
VLAYTQAVDPSESGDLVHIHGSEQQRAVHELEHLLQHDADKAKSVSFTYHHAQKHNPRSPTLGETSHKTASSTKAGPADGLIEMGDLLNGMRDIRRTSTGQAVESLTGALRAKLLMDTLKPSAGSYVDHPKAAPSLGDSEERTGGHPTFDQLMHAKEKNMAAITQYLMQRKSEGRPLTADEDQQLQKFYYNRASTILKKIVLLKQGETIPHTNDPVHDDDRDTQPAESGKLVDPTLDHETDNNSAATTDKLKYDTKVAKANTAYNNKEARKLVRQEEAADAENEAEDKQEMDSLAFDQKVATANEQYNERLLSEVQKEADNAAHVSDVARKAAEALKAGLNKQHKMSNVEKQLEKQKLAAERAVERFTNEQEDAEEKVHAAEKAKSEADKEADKASRMLILAEKTAAANAHSHVGHKKAHLKLPHLPAHERLSNMVKYLRTALSHHNVISKEDLQIMQNFFLQHGGKLLSKLAQIEPDATWTDKGVVNTEQWAMDHGHPDQLSEEWGGKKVKQETLVRDAVQHEFDKRESHQALSRPANQQVEGLFGMAAKLPLKFAPDYSAKIDKEPLLGEGLDDEEVVHPNKHAYSSMLGIQGA